VLQLYTRSASNFVDKMTYQPVVLCGPSGAGKSTLLQRLMKEYVDCFAFSISHTTRKPRPGEVHGKDYYFVSRDEMKESINQGEFVEYAEFSGNLYGTSKKAISDISSSGRICVLDIDTQGVKSVKQTDLNPKYIFIKPPSISDLKERLQGRGTETADSLAKRLKAAQTELDYAEEPGAFDNIIINNDLDMAYDELKNILIKDINEILNHKHQG
jgi:guanylate kinase